ncbi:MAG: helix-turn-helix domain-containing protein [Candidatus Binatia bacterium]
MGGPILTLDNLLSASVFFVGKWTPALKRNQSRDVLRLLICKFHGASHGNLFKAQIQASQDDLASRLDLSREWVCKLLKRLEAERWIVSKAIRLPDGKFLPCYFRPGGQLKRVLCILLGYRRQPRPSRVNTPSQYLPSLKEREKSLFFIRQIKELLTAKMRK